MTTTAADLLALVAAQGRTIAVAESLTGGALASELVAVPGASAAFRGGIVAYATDLKASILGVDAALLARVGAVHPTVAEQMAVGVAKIADAGVGVATTGVAGPDRQDGQQVGTVYVATAVGPVTNVRRLEIMGDRRAVRSGAVAAALDHAYEVLTNAAPLPDDSPGTISARREL